MARWTALLIVLAVATACGGGRDDGGGDAPATVDADANADGDTDADRSTIDASNCDQSEFTNGISDDAIKIGSSFAQSGPFAAFAEASKGIRAYFD